MYDTLWSVVFFSIRPQLILAWYVVERIGFGNVPLDVFEDLGNS